MNLYRVMIKVRPQVNTADFYEAQFGWLLVWVLAESRQDAARRVGPSIIAARCEVVDTGSLLSLREDEFPTNAKNFDASKRAALAGEPNSWVFWRPVGSDEDEENFTQPGCFPLLDGVPIPSGLKPRTI
jgi:hypothetical protein